MSGYVVGVDGSAQSSVALEWALTRASREGQPVRLVLVIDDEVGLVGEDYALDAERAGRKILAEVTIDARERYPDLSITPAALHGSVPWELSHAATSSDVLVIGTHRAGPTGTLLGSRSVQVASITPAVLAVIPAASVDQPGPVVAGVSMREPGGSAVLHAAREAADSGRDLLLVYAAGPVETGPLGDAHTALAHTALGEAKAVALEVHPGLSVSTEFVTADPAEALLAAAAARNASMVVLGPSRTFGTTGSPIGTVTQSMLLNAPCPVLVTRYSSV